MKIKKRLLSLALSGAMMLGLMPGMNMTALAADNVSTYTLQIPSTLNVSAAGWNETSGLTAAVSSGDTFDSGKKLSVTAASANSWALKSGSNSVGYNLATATGTYSSTATPASWEFTAAELNASGGTNKAMGIIVDDYSTMPAGTYQDTVTFTASVESAAAAPTLTLGEMTQGGDPLNNGSGSETYYSPTFSEGQQVAVFYKNTSGQTVKVLSDALTASDISNEGKSATINVTIDDADKTQPVTYFYPATMAKDDGSINFDFTAQSGTEASLSTVRNCCKGSGAWDGNALPSVSMASQIDIWKLTMTGGDGMIMAQKVTVKVGGNKVAEASASGVYFAYPIDIYLALNPATMETGTLRIEADEFSTIYYYQKDGGVSLTAGKFYQSAVELKR